MRRRPGNRFDALLDAGIIGQPVEFYGGHWRCGGYDYHFTAEMAADAARLGVRLPT